MKKQNSVINFFQTSLGLKRKNKPEEEKIDTKKPKHELNLSKQRAIVPKKEVKKKGRKKDRFHNQKTISLGLSGLELGEKATAKRIKTTTRSDNEIIDPQIYNNIPPHLQASVDSVRLLPCLRPEPDQIVRELAIMIRDVEIYRQQVYIFGSTVQGNSVTLHVNFEPWFFVQCPSEWTRQDLINLKTTLNSPEYQAYEKNAIKTIEFENNRHELIGWNFELPTKVARIRLTSLKSYRHYLAKFQTPLLLNGQSITFKLFNEDIPPRVQLLTAIDATMYGWIKIARQDLQFNKKLPHPVRTQLQFQTDYSRIVSDKQNPTLAPIYRCSFDIETVPGSSIPDRFGRATNPGDLIICISNWMYVSNEIGEKALVCFSLGHVVFKSQTPAELQEELKEHGLPPNTIILQFTTETELLLAWREYVFIKTDIDELVSYNGIPYDMRYILERAEVLGIRDEMLDMSRFKGVSCELREKKSTSNQRGDEIFMYAEIYGRMQFDVMRLVKKKQLSNYSLKAAAKALLKDKNQEKIDLPAQLIRPYFVDSPEKRAELLIYCARDSQITNYIAVKQTFYTNHYEMSKLTSTSNTQLLINGESVKVWTIICDKIERDGWLLHKPDLDKINEEFPIEYEGGKVLEPIIDFYVEPIACLDFSSLYPSIMRSISSCYSTLLLDPIKIAAARAAGYIVLEIKVNKESKYNPHFVQGCKKQLIPNLLAELTAARKAAQKLEELEQDTFIRSTFKSRQLALKLTGNATYGFTSAGNDCKTKSGHKNLSSSMMMISNETTKLMKPRTNGGMLSCVAIAAACTARGREMILQTKKTIEKDGNEVIYGDTDSVFVRLKSGRGLKFPVNGTPDELQKILEFMKEGTLLAERVTEEFVKPNKLNFEKLFVRILLQGKKKYASHYYEIRIVNGVETIVPSGLAVKGMEAVRRDWCDVSRRTSRGIIDGILAEKPIEEVVGVFADTVEKMRRKELPLSDYKLSKGLKAEYASEKVAHWQVAQKIAQRRPERALGPGDRVQYLVCDLENVSQAHLRGEEYEYAEKHGLEVDRKYYFEKQILPPAVRALKTILKENTEPTLRLLGSDLLRECDRNQDLRKLMPSSVELSLTQKC